MNLPFRIGFGYDVHAFAENRKLILGGVEIPHTKGLAGHSDADVLLHSICDAMLGALSLGDIGKHFPDTSKDFKDIDSRILLERTNQLIKEKGYLIGNVDATIAMQKPKLSPYIQKIREEISAVLQCNIEQVSVKATTTEELGFVGKEEGVSSYSVVLLYKANQV